MWGPTVQNIQKMGCSGWGGGVRAWIPICSAPISCQAFPQNWGAAEFEILIFLTWFNTFFLFIRLVNLQCICACVHACVKACWAAQLRSPGAIGGAQGSLYCETLGTLLLPRCWCWASVHQVHGGDRGTGGCFERITPGSRLTSLSLEALLPRSELNTHLKEKETQPGCVSVTALQSAGNSDVGWVSHLHTLFAKLGSSTYCFSFSEAPSMVMKKMLIPDSLANLDASSTLSVGQPSTITTATLGAPPLFPLDLEKNFWVTKEMARPGRKRKLVLGVIMELIIAA